MRWEHELRHALSELARSADEVPENEATERRLLQAFDDRVGERPGSPSLVGVPDEAGWRRIRRAAPLQHGRVRVRGLRWPLAAAASVALLAGGWWALSRPDAPPGAARGVARVSRPADAPPATPAPADAARIFGPADSRPADAAGAARGTTDVARVLRPAKPSAVAPNSSASSLTDADDDTEEFVALPAAERLPGFESGMIVRVELPVTSLPAYGYPIVPDGARTAVAADILVGQDGQPRAMRLVSTQTGVRRRQ